MLAAIGKCFCAIGTLFGIALVVLALWGWNESSRLAMFWARPEVGAWAIRSAAISAAAAGQVLLLVCAAGRLLRAGAAGASGGARRDWFGTGLKLGAAMVCAGALASAVALGWAGR